MANYSAPKNDIAICAGEYYYVNLNILEGNTVCDTEYYI